MFWMNMLHAEKANWAAYAPGGAHPRQRHRRHRRQPHPADVPAHRAVQPALVHLQPALPDHAPARRLGQDLGQGAPPARAAAPSGLYGTADADVRRRLHLPVQPGRLRPGQPRRANNALSTYATNPLWQVVDGPWHLTHFDADRQRDLRPQPELLGPGEADDQDVRRAAVHLGPGRVQRPGRRPGERRATSRRKTSRPRPATRVQAGPNNPHLARELHAGAAVRLVDQLLPVQLQLDR